MTEGVLQRTGKRYPPSGSFTPNAPQNPTHVAVMEPGAAVHIPHLPVRWKKRAVVLMRARFLDTCRAVARPFVVSWAFVATTCQPVSQALWRAVYTLAVLLSLLALGTKRLVLGVATGCRVAVSESLHHLRRRLRLRLHTMLLYVCAGLFLISAFYYTLGLEVILDGQSVGFVSSQSQFEEAVELVSQRAADILNHPYVLTPKVTYRYSLVNRHALFNEDDVKTLLFRQIDEIENLYVLSVDGEPVGISDTAAPLEALLEELLAPYQLDDENSVTRFARDVQVSRQWADATLLRDIPAIREKLSANLRDDVQVTVQPGDDLVQLAQARGMSPEDILALNPGLETTGLVPGETLLLRRAVPVLPVETLQEEVVPVEIPFATLYEDDPDSYEGTEIVRVGGMPGDALSTREIRFVNGQEMGREEVALTVLTEPTTEVVARGTKVRPPKSPTGSYMRPYYGVLTSNFGYRKFGGGENHKGIDLAGPTGSPIVASDGGTVTFAGTKSGYGLTVMISHGGGVETLYGHCSKLLVKVGQAVAKGEQIAKVGSTGRSTGPHLHFEVRVGGKAVSPWKYID